MSKNKVASHFLMSNLCLSFLSQIPLFGNVVEVCPSFEALPTVHFDVNKETTFSDLKVMNIHSLLTFSKTRCHFCPSFSLVNDQLIVFIHSLLIASLMSPTSLGSCFCFVSRYHCGDYYVVQVLSMHVIVSAWVTSI